MTPRLAIVAADAVEPRLLEEGIRGGWLPNLASFLAAGSSVPLLPADSAFPGAAWPTLITGVRLAQHRVLRDRRLADNSYSIVDVPASALAVPPFWRYVSDHGLHSTVVNLYGAPLVDHFKGTQLHGWATLDPYSSKFGTTLADPPETVEWLEREAGHPTMTYEGKAPRTPKEVLQYRHDRLEDIRIRGAAYALLLKRTAWDLAFFSFPEIHQAGHLLWHLHDPEHPDHDPAAAPELKGVIRELYQALDTAVGHVLALVPADATAMLVTPHGMGINHVLGDPGEEILTRGGWFSDQASAVEHGSGRRRATAAAWQAARRLVPEQARLALRRRVADRPWVAGMALAHVDWSSTRAFSVPPDMGSYIRLNVAGREPAGIVQPGAEYEELCREIISAVSELVFTKSGRPAIERVLGPDEIGGPAAADGLPDITIIWSRAEPLRSIRSDRLGTIEVVPDDLRTGQHRPMGFLAAVGPNVPARGAFTREGPAASLLDLAPTALTALGVPVPATLEGTPIDVLLG